MSSNLAVYIVSAFIGLVIAFLLINLARLSKKISISPNSGSSREEHPVFDAAKDAFLRHNLYKEISKFAASNQDAQVAADSVADIFGRELERRVVTTQQELSRKYNNIIEQKIQSEEVAWKKYNKALAEKRDTDAVIRNIAEGLVVLDAKGKVIMMNPAAEKLLGTQRKDMVGKSIVENLKEEQLISLVKDSKDKGEKGEKEIELVSQSNETKKVLRASSA
ncbi:MAG: PAS domain-containing protein, partial [Candidatus Omnitrophica bacterium]|nr:PAS domain-containing protein [Candidatus Omnitrophota bacterium]